jgi:TfoX/Sxy family transcriptional regulator of competence genes
MEPFSYQTKKAKVQVKKYYSAPADIFEDQEKCI